MAENGSKSEKEEQLVRKIREINKEVAELRGGRRRKGPGGRVSVKLRR